MQGRNFSSQSYRYGFNGKEKDDEVSGDGNDYNYGFRIYNSRLGRFLSVDPIARNFPWYTPYQYAGNKPIYAIDIDGLEDGAAERTAVMKDAKNLGVTENEFIRSTVGNADGIVHGVGEIASAGFNLGSTLVAGVGNAATVYIPQTFGFKGTKEWSVLTTEGFKTFGSADHTQITYKSAGAVGTTVATAAAIEGVGAIAFESFSAAIGFAKPSVFIEKVAASFDEILTKSTPYKTTEKSIIKTNSGSAKEAFDEIVKREGGKPVDIVDKGDGRYTYTKGKDTYTLRPSGEGSPTISKSTKGVYQQKKIRFGKE